MIPVNEPVISEQSKKNLKKAVDTGWLSSSGPFVRQFEEEFAGYLGVKHAITVSNGTAALHVALLALGIGRGDEVIVPAFTMGATWMAVMYTGAKPVFVDCELETYNIDPDLIKKKITKRTRAIIPVHIYGQACDMDAINKIAKKHKLLVIEDAAEALGGEYRGRKCGTLSDIACFSFYANKIVTAGEGGMIVTNNAKWAREAERFKDLYHSDKKRFIHEKLGYNFRMTNLQAAVGLGELKNIKKYLAKKQWMAELYEKGLRGVRGISLPQTLAHVKNTFWMYGILIHKSEFGMSRDQLREKLKNTGVDSRDFFYPPEDQPLLKKIIGSQRFPNTKYLSQNGLYLPSGLAITEKQIQTVYQAIKNYAHKTSTA